MNPSQFEGAPRPATLNESGSRQRRFLIATGLLAGFLLLPNPERGLHALPPIEIDFLDANTVEVTWPDTGEDVQLESSGDLGASDIWRLSPGTPELQDGVFRLPIPVDPSGNAYFRLTESMLDPTAPVFDNPPATNVSIFPGQQVSFTLAATDPGGLAVSFVAEPLPLPTGATLNMTTGEFSWTPAESQIGSHVITFLAYNGSNSGRLPVTFTIQQPPAGGETSLSGIVLDTTDAVAGNTRPIAGVVVSLLGTEISDVTGADGRFLLQGAPGGKQVLDLATAEALPAPDGSPYAGFREAIGIVGRIANVVERPFYLPRIAAASLTTVDPNFTTMVENPDLAITLTVAPHTAVLGADEFTGELSISEVPEGLAPAAMPPNLNPGLLITIQPVGVIFAEPAPISFPNIDGLSPGSETDLWSLDPQLGAFAIVGRGRVSEDGTRIDTFEGGVRAADWHFVLPPNPANGPPPDPPPPCENKCCVGPSGPSGGGSGGGPAPGGGPFFGHNEAGENREDGEAAEDQRSGGKPQSVIAAASHDADGYIHFSSQVSPGSGALRTWFQLPAYTSLDVERALTFYYNSNQAYPHVLVPMTGEISVRSAVPPTVSARLQLAGLDCGIDSFMATTGFSENRNEPFRIVSAMDASALATGVYPFSVKLSSNFSRSSVAADVGNQILIVNRRGSPFGNGWGLAGLQRVHGDPASPVGVIVTDGSGAADRYTGSVGTLPFTVAALDSEAAGDYSLVEGSLFDEARAALARETGGSLMPVSALTAAEIGTADVVFISPYLSATDGRPLTAAEQADVLAFVQGGGCVVALIDHTLRRSSFAAAIDSIAGLFQIETADTAEAYTGAPEGDILAGFFGIVSQVDRPFGGAAITGLGPWAEGIGARDDAGYPGAFIPAGAIAPGSGPVVLLPDVHSFTDDLTIGFTTSSHRALFLNAFGACVEASISREETRVLRGTKGAFGNLEVDNATGAMVRKYTDGSEAGFDASGIQRTMADPVGNVTTYEYSGGNLSRITDPAGRVTTLSYSGGKLASITDPAGRVTEFTFDGDDLISVDLPGDMTRQFGYDDRSLMISETDTNGGEITRVFDAFGCIVSADIPGGIHRTLATAAGVGLIDPSTGGVGTEANPAPPTRPEDAVATFTDGAGREKEYVFNPDGSAGGASDAFGVIARIQSDADRNPVEETGSDGRSYSRVFDRLGRMISETDNITGGTTRYEYEGESAYPSAIAQPNGHTGITEYNGSQLARVQTPAGRIWQATYNNLGLVSELVMPSGLVREYAYDAAGNPLSTSDAADGVVRTTTFTNNATGQQASYTSPGGAHFTYDYNPMGILSVFTAPGNRSYTYQADGEGNVVSITMPGGQEHRMTYSAEGALLTYDFPPVGGDSSQTRYELDGDGKRSTIRRPDGDDFLMVADAAGRIASQQSSAGVSTFDYTDADQPTRITSPGGIVLDYTYSGNLLNLLQWTGPVSGSVSRSYDQSGQLVSRNINNGAPVTFAYDADGLMTQSGDLSITLDSATGLPVTDQLGGVRVDRVYTGFGELSSYVARSGGSPVFSQAHTFDADGRLVETTEFMLGATTVKEYEYDAADRLSAMRTDGSPAATYTYDANNNRLSAIDAGLGTRTATYDAQDRLIALGGANYTYDAAGDLQSVAGGAGTTTYDFDPLGNLRSAELPSGAAIEYLIDGENRRVGKRVDGSLAQGFLWQDRYRIAAELDGAGSVVAEFFYVEESTTPAYMRKGGATYCILTDHIGSPRLVVDTASGAVAQRIDYDPWGRVLTDTSPGFQPFGFAGGLYDQDTGLLRFGAREYDPVSSRWLTRDLQPFRVAEHNLYQYASSDPVNFTDPTGFAVAGETGGAKRLVPGGFGEETKCFIIEITNGAKETVIEIVSYLPWGRLGKIGKWVSRTLKAGKGEIKEQCKREKPKSS